jgi:hypothetical protein
VKRKRLPHWVSKLLAKKKSGNRVGSTRQLTTLRVDAHFGKRVTETAARHSTTMTPRVVYSMAER